MRLANSGNLNFNTQNTLVNLLTSNPTVETFSEHEMDAIQNQLRNYNGQYK